MDPTQNNGTGYGPVGENPRQVAFEKAILIGNYLTGFGFGTKVAHHLRFCHTHAPAALSSCPRHVCHLLTLSVE